MTILKGSEKIVASLNQFGVVRRVRRGHYVIAEPIELNDELTRFLVFADMLVNRSSYRTFLELQDVAELFPFACRVSKEELVADERFEGSSRWGYGSRRVQVTPTTQHLCHA